MQQEFTPEERLLADEALAYVKANKKLLIEEFSGSAFAPSATPMSFFMAGSPGAGKTEFSERLLKTLTSDKLGLSVVRIDGDEIRKGLPGYLGGNASVFNSAVNKGVEIIHDSVIDKNKTFILDGTLSSYDVAVKNISRSLSRDRGVVIVFVYQDPVTAWGFTKAREADEGRNIPRDAFIEKYFGSQDVVTRLKRDFGDKVEVWFVERNLKNNEIRLEIDIKDLKGYIKIPYTREQLEAILPL